MLELSFEPFRELSTQRLSLRAIVPADAPALFALRSDLRVMQHIGRPLARTLADAEQLIRDMRDSQVARTGVVWAMALRGDPTLVGTIGFWRIAAEHHHGELGYLLKPELWRQGLMREAALAVLGFGFETLRFHRIEACVDPSNQASIALLERLGFVREAWFTQNFQFQGAFLDTLVFAQLASSWAKRALDRRSGAT